MDWTEGELKDFVENIYKDFCRIANEKLDLSYADITQAGIIGAKIFEAEFRLFGPIAYATSLMLPMRNAGYCRVNTLARWNGGYRHVQNKLIPPILDYGCGVGYTLAFLSQVMDGEPELYGMELAGVQWGFMSALGQIYNFEPWDNQPVNTIICTNMLEHLPHPVETLEYFYSLTPNVLANVDFGPQEDHIAPMDERRECIRILQERGGLLWLPEDE